jgi:hypothetical protein
MPVRLRREGGIVLALGVVGAMLVLWREHRSATPVQELAREAPEPAPEEPAAAAAPVAALEDERQAICSGTELSLAERGSVRRICVETVEVDQNGSVRSYRVDLSDGAGRAGSPRRSLSIDAIGTRVITAVMKGGGVSGGAYQDAFELRCREAACAGITIGARDVQGARLIRLDNAKLLPQLSVGTAVDGGVQLNGQLRTPPEEQLAGLACTDQGVTIVSSRSSSTAFCPRGGAGFELVGDGTKLYRFTNLDGESIGVSVDDAERVKRVEYQGEEKLVCSSPACARVQISTPGPSGERTFTFSGTTLTESSKAESNAVMSGTLILPPL